MLAAGIGWRLFDFFRVFYFFNLIRVLPGNDLVISFFFGGGGGGEGFRHFSATYNVVLLN